LSRKNTYAAHSSSVRSAGSGVGDVGLAAVVELGLVARARTRGRGSAASVFSSVGHGGGAVLVDERAGGEAVEAKGAFSGCGSPCGDGVREGPADAGGGLETAGAPAAVEVQVLDRGGPTIGEASGVTSTMPPQVRSTCARAKTGNSSTAAAIWCSMTWNEPRWP
jgi:hypothetical protein